MKGRHTAAPQSPAGPGPGLYDPHREHDACGVGFTARLDGAPSHAIVEHAVSALGRMAHRGGSGCGPQTADGAGVLVSMPRTFMRSAWRPLCGDVPEQYGLAQVFLTPDPELRRSLEELVADVLCRHGFRLAAWRDTPVRPELLQPHAAAAMPVIRQFLALPLGDAAERDAAAFERRLYLARRHMERAVAEETGCGPDQFHVASFSSHSVVYKGMLPGGQLAAFYPDLSDREFTAHLAVFHERYSTNTTPSWRLAQPFRCLAHNGEINTLQSNQAAMRMREPLLASPLFGDGIRHLTPVLESRASDSAMLDNALELLVHGGRDLAHAAMMLVPEPFGPGFIMGEDKRAFYEYHAALMEPWDGPSALVFTDGHRQVGAMLDRNALRPCRYAVTTDGTVILASEAGVLDLPDEQVARRGRLQPRRMLMVDFARHRLVSDAECRGRVMYAKPYRHWVRDQRITLRDLPLPAHMEDDLPPAADALLREQQLFGFTGEEVAEILEPMARNAQEPVASMGCDTPLAVLSQRPQLLFSYLKQRFAQVTNPPIDPLREGLVMTLTGFAGRRGNLLEETPDHYSLLRLANPVLFADDLARLRVSRHPAVRVAELDMLFDAPPAHRENGHALQDGETALAAGLDRLFAAADAALDAGAALLLLSDARADATHIPVPSLLAVSGLHHHLLRTGRRHACGLLVDAGDCREVMHLAQLIAFGASGVHPRVALATVSSLAAGGRLGAEVTPRAARAAYATALQKGLLKTFSRMGISTLRSFACGQGFEALGFSREFTDRYFTGLPSRIGGIGLASVAADALVRHAAAFPASPPQSGDNDPAAPASLTDAGMFRNRNNGERHLWTPAAIRALHRAVRNNDWESYLEYARESDEQTARPVTLRGLLEFAPGDPLPLDEVESEEAILRRFVGAAMSYGSISPEAHEAIAVACNRVGARSNCGEGGEAPERNLPLPDGGSARSRVRQIASGRFGVTASYLVQADEVQIKMAQGAKPGEGGQLPAHKVLPEIARVRGTLAGVTLISPPPHHDIYSIEDLAQLIYDVKHLNPKAAVSVKLVAGTNVGTIASGVAKAGADIILISGHDGGTGASPRTAISHVGLPWEMGLAETHAALLANGLRGRVRLQADGQLRTGRDLAVAALLGAEEFGLGAGLLVALGCCMLRVCHLGTCPVGVAAQDPKLRAKFRGSADHVERYLRFLAADLRRHMAALGFARVEDMLGRADRLRPAPLADQTACDAANPALGRGFASWQAKIQGLDLSALLAPAPLDRTACDCTPADFGETDLERRMLAAVLPGVRAGRPTRYEGVVRNTDRAVGARLAGEVARLHGDAGLAPGMVDIRLTGTAGQSAGAFLPRGILLAIHGEANDYVGKGLCGGSIAVTPPPGAVALADERAAIGNVALYGATGGELFVAGSAGERFAVRNSGAQAVVEGVGDHGCEYMTGGTVVVLGPTGYNFAAGMSGGVAYVLDRSEQFQTRCNLDGVDLESLWRAEDVRLVRSLLERHVRFTGSVLARSVLDDWDALLPLFLKVTPVEYSHALERMKQGENPQAESVAATEEVYHP